MCFISIKSKCNFIILFGFSLSAAAYSQVFQNGRFEIPINNDIESYSVLPIDTAGIVLYRNFIGPKENLLELTRLDTVFNSIWKGYLPVPKEYSFVFAKAVDSKVYFFFKPQDPSKHNFFTTVVKIKDGGYVSYHIENLIPFNPTEYAVCKNALLIGGYFNLRPVVLLYSLTQRKSHMLPGFLNEPGEITQIKTYADGNVDVIVSAKNSTRRKCLWIRQFNNAGDMIKTVVLEPGENKNLIFGRAAKTENDKQVIAGVYGRNAQYSRGVFVAEVDPNGEYVIHYYNFGDLKNFFHYLKAKKEKRIKERIERRKIKGKKIRFNYRLLVHEVVPYQDQFIMLGEAFFPHYASRGNYAYFDGYEYTHAVIIGFDAQAKLLWDNSFQTSGVKSYQLQQFVRIAPAQDRLVLLYLFENTIRSKIIHGSEVIEGSLQEQIRMQNGEKAIGRKIQNSNLEYWYGSHLFVHGTQNLTNSEDNNLHKVFFINKLKVHYSVNNDYLLPFKNK
jgi:hypothetical protein